MVLDNTGVAPGSLQQVPQSLSLCSIIRRSQSEKPLGCVQRAVCLLRDSFESRAAGEVSCSSEPQSAAQRRQRSGSNARSRQYRWTAAEMQTPPPNTNAQNTPQRAVSVLSSVQRHRASVAHRTSCCTGRRSVCRPLQAAKPQISEWHSDTRWRCSILRSHPTHLNAR